MKIARLIEGFPEKNTGGLVPNAYYLSKYQIEDGHEVVIFTFGEKDEEREKDGIKIIQIKRPHLRRIFGGYKLNKEIRKRNFDPDIIHSLSCLPLGWLFPFYKNKTKAKYVMSIHGTINPLKNNQVRGIRSWKDSFEYGKLMRFLAKRVDLVLPVAGFIKEEMVKEGIDENKIKVFPTGLEYDLFAGKERIKHDKFTILFVGRFAQMKGLKYLMEAVSKLKKENIRLVLAGGRKTDNDYDNVMRLIDELDLKNIVEIKKSIPYEKLYTIYQEADVFVLPSTCEPRAKVIQEAMASGVPIIATDQGGVRENILDNENGLLVPIKDAAAIKEAILKIKNNPHLKNKLLTNGAETAKRYDWVNIAESYNKLFNELI